jgi:hypothetical protein
MMTESLYHSPEKHSQDVVAYLHLLDEILCLVIAHTVFRLS